MKTSKARVLVVEDFTPFQKMICWILQEMPELQIVGVFADGLWAVRETLELEPDLIIMDIGLPGLNGLDTARRILEIMPQCKVLFLTQESSLDVVQIAFRLGASGYVLKERAITELLPAVSAVLEEKHFASSGIGPFSASFADPALETTANPNNEADSVRSAHSSPGRCHELHVYSDEAILLDSAACFVETAIRKHEPVVLVAGEAVRSSLFYNLQSKGIDRVTAQRGDYISLDAQEMISMFMSNGSVDAVRFTELFRGIFAAIVTASPTDSPKIAVFSECSAQLWAAGKSEAAFRAEQLCNELAAQFELNLLCAYPGAKFHGEEDIHDLKKVCAQHSTVHSR